MNHSSVKRRSKNFNLSLLIGCSIIGIFLLGYFGIPKFISSATATVARPVWSLGSAIGLRFEELSLHFQSKQALVKENETLRATIATLTFNGLENEILKYEIKNIKGLIDSQTLLTNFKVVRVLAHPPTSLHGTLLIGYGEKDGAHKGARIFSNNNALLGEIVEIYSGTSKVMLYSAPGVTHSGQLLDPAIEVSLTGRGGGNFLMELPRDTFVKEGSPIIVPGAPSAIIGIVGKIISDPRDPLEEVLVTTPVNIFELSWILVE